MDRAHFKKLLAVGVAIVGLGLCAVPANAGWWHAGCGWNSGCCDIGYGGCYGGCYHHRCGWGGCGYGYGCGYGWGSCGYDCGGVGWNSCCGTPIAYSGCGCSSCGGGQAITEPAGTPPTLPPTPSTPPAPPTTPPPPPMSPSNAVPGATPPNRTSLESSAGEDAFLAVRVPSDAKVTINGALTKSTGSERRYVSYGLRPGHTYVFTIKAEIVRDGKVVSKEQSVPLMAGTQRGVAFDFNVPSGERLATTK